MLIHRHKLAAVMSRRGNDDLIGRVAVKSPRQAARVGGDVRREFKKSDSGIGERRMEPLIGGHGEPEAPTLHQFRNYPAGDRADADVPRFVLGNERLGLRRQPIILVHPPDSHVRVENDDRGDCR